MKHISALALLLAALAFAAAPLLTPGFGGYDASQFPVQSGRPLILPAGYAFALWGLIYAGLIGHAAFGLIYRADAPGWRDYCWPLTASLGLGTFWLLVATLNPVLATVHIWAMWAFAVWAALRIHAGALHWLALVPVALYAGWLTAASCVSLGTVLIGYGILSNETASFLMLVLALALGIALQLSQRRAPAFGLAIVWALIGIVAAVGLNGGIGWSAAIGALIMLGVSFTQLRSAKVVTKPR